jgi:hypothetical protein
MIPIISNMPSQAHMEEVYFSQDNIKMNMMMEATNLMMRVASILMEVMMTQLLQLDNLTFHSAEK